MFGTLYFETQLLVVTTIFSGSLVCMQKLKTENKTFALVAVGGFALWLMPKWVNLTDASANCSKDIE